MTRFEASLSLLLAITLSAALVAAEKASLYDVGSRRQLLIDKAFFDQSRNLRLRLHPARKTGEIVLKREHPWESATLNWFSVIQDAGVVDKEAKYRMWYECYDVAGWPTADDTSFCYAESRDGVHWTKPSVGLVEYQGSKNNNILFRQLGPAGAHSRVHGTGVFLDHGAPPEARFKAVSQGIWQGKTPPHRIAGMFSADGLRWTRCAEPICDIPADSQYSCFWDPGVGKFLLFGRVGGRGRAIGRSESKDFFRFDPLKLVLQADERDPPRSDLYNPAAIRCPDAANVYFMFPSLYQHDPDTLDVRMAVSRDGSHWTWPEQDVPFVPLGRPGAFDSKTLYMGQGLIEAGDEWWLYYSGSPLAHQESELDKLVRTAQPRVYSRLVARRDRLVSVDAGPEGGYFVTPPLQFTGTVLTLNVEVRPGGRVRVGLLDEKGEPVPGRAVEDCLPITGDHLGTIVRWNHGTDLGHRVGIPTRMRVELTNASLYAFTFAEAQPSGLPAAGRFRLWQIPPQARSSSHEQVMMSYVTPLSTAPRRSVSG
jgi:hypothetical protein